MIAIIGILVALLLPAVQAAREAARRIQCKNNLRNIGLACLNHVDSLGAFPTGGDRWSPQLELYIEGGKPLGVDKQGLGWGFQILPYLEEGAIHSLTTEQDISDTVVPLYVCPSRRGITKITFPANDLTVTLTDYAGVHPCTKIWNTDDLPLDLTTQPTPGTVRSYFVKSPPGSTDREPLPNAVYDGVIVRSPWLNDWGAYDHRFQKPSGEFVEGVPHPVGVSKITDGTSKTMLIAEKYIRFDLYGGGSASDDRGWTDGWDADTMRCTCISPLNDGQIDPEHSPSPPLANNSSFYTLIIGSAHTGGFNAVFADGSVHTVNYDIDLPVLNALGTRNGTSAGRGGPNDPEVVSTEGVN